MKLKVQILSPKMYREGLLLNLKCYRFKDYKSMVPEVMFPWIVLFFG